MKVIIVGLGDIGHQVATSLEHRGDMRLVLVDADDARCKYLSEHMDALVIEGDGSDPSILQEAGVKDADALIVSTGSDSLNTVIAMLAKQQGAEKIMVKLRESYLRPALQEIGVTRIVTPQVSAAAEFTAALFGFAHINTSLLVRGGVQLAEVPPGNAADRKIGEVDLPEGARIVALLREDSAVIPNDDTGVRTSDVLLMLVRDEHILESAYKRLGL